MEKKISWPMIAVAGGGLVIGLWGLSSILSTVASVFSPRQQPPMSVQAFQQFPQPSPQVNVYINNGDGLKREQPVVVTQERPQWRTPAPPMPTRNYEERQDMSLPPPLRRLEYRAVQQGGHREQPPPPPWLRRAQYAEPHEGFQSSQRAQGQWVLVSPWQSGRPPFGEPNSVFRWHGFYCKQPWYDVHHGPSFYTPFPKCWRFKNMDEDEG
jgi:hypothetical protein